MNRKNAENARTTPAAPNAPAPMPAFFADRLISVLASSTSPRIRVETSDIALCTSEPTEGSAGGAGGAGLRSRPPPGRGGGPGGEGKEVGGGKGESSAGARLL